MQKYMTSVLTIICTKHSLRQTRRKLCSYFHSLLRHTTATHICLHKEHI